MDSESGLHHLAHAICCLMFQLEKELEKEQVQPCGIATNPGETFTVIRKGTQTDLVAQDKAPGEFSVSNLPLIGEEYYYLSNTGVVAARRWQSTPQEWKRLHNGQVFKSEEACREKGYHTPYVFHEDDPVSYPELGDEVWIARSVINGENELRWEADSKPYRVVSTDVGPGGTGLAINYANGWHKKGELFYSKERAEAKAHWRNLSMKAYGTPYGPLHPDSKPHGEPLFSSYEGEKHD